MEWLEGGSGLAVYLALKLGGYLVWSHVGVRWLGRTTRPAVVALLLGTGRLVIGWATGLAVAPLALVAVSTDHVPVFYFTALVVVRWFEWGIIQILIPGRVPGPGIGFVTGGSKQGRIWRIAGIGISYLADAPFLVVEGFPHGRIFC